jgi:AraC-like DNA-binding protein
VASRTDWLLDADRSAKVADTAQRLVIDSEAWRASVESLDVGLGLRVFLTEAEARTEAGLEPSHNESQSWFATNVLLRGRVRLAFADGRITVADTTRTLAFHPAAKRARYIVDPGARIRLAGFRINRERLAGIFGDRLPPWLEHLMAPQHDETRVVSVRTTGQIRRAAQAVYAAPLSGPLRAAYLEGVVLQLLALGAAAADAQAAGAQHVALIASMQKKLLEARERLLADMRHPPSLGELAASAGMSEKMLNAGFRTLFGATVFETLRNERLEHARFVLDREDVPLKLVAARVGYRHVSNFITAFAARFGETPRRYRDDRSGD